ncbi:MAG TPA: ligase-associated DNA damage response endonuclease PdeM [Geminicoccaceae bacterium]|nr:ligase-associated DNA damage response endonuclease PdeM [Geminicoccus sp.]HMU51264.1 ligase-associated DNA damage response endonuclease PdeM [Geminicoccaceae bacterium]
MTGAEIRLGRADFRLDPAGALWWQRRRMLVVADLHLEKGAAFARRGSMLPPYDTSTTLARLEALVARHRPAIVVSLGDGFHDRRGGEALERGSAERIRALTGAVRWLWVAGNHDPAPPEGLGGEPVAAFEMDGIGFGHVPGARAGFEVAGHLHPKARLSGERRAVTRPCFVADPSRLILPAFGAFAGGLDVLDPAISGLFGAGFDAFLLGQERVFRVPHHRLDPLAWPERFVTRSARAGRNA